MSLFSALRDGYHSRNRNQSRKARRGLAPFGASRPRRDRLASISLVEMLEARELLTAVVTTDLSDYPPGSTAIITASNDATTTGANFLPGETVQFQVTRTDGIPDYPNGNLPWKVTDGVWSLDGGQTQFTPYQDTTGTWVYPDSDHTQNSSIGTSWYVENQYAGASLELMATGLTSKAVATTDFADGTITVITGSPVSISADTVSSGTWTTLTGPTYTEASKGDVGTGTIILSAPTGFVFDTTSNAFNPVPAVMLAAGSGTQNSNINNLNVGDTIPATVSSDGSSITITITAKSTSTKNTLVWQNIRVRPSSGTPLVNGNITSTGTASLAGVTSGVTSWGSINEVAGAAAKFGFTSSSQTMTAGSTSSTITVQLQDRFGNPVSAGAGGQVVNLSTVSSGGTFVDNTTGSTITSVTIPNGSNSVTFKYTDTVAGTVAITASASGRASATQSETVNAGAASKYSFVTSTQTLTAGVVSGTITVQTQDQYGNPTNAGNPPNGRTITLSTSSASGVFRDNATGNFVTTTVSIAQNQQTASFKYFDTTAGTPIITASGGGLTSVTQTETVIAAAASKLTYLQQPSSTTYGQAISPSVTVRVEDAFGNLTTSTANIAIALGTNLTGANLGGTATVAASGGIAIFSGLTVSKAGTGYTLLTSSGTLTGAISGSFNVGKATAAVSVTPYTSATTIYDALVHGATGTVTGIGGVNLAGLDLSGTNHINAGSYTDTWIFTDSTGNYNNSSGTITDSIAQASPAFSGLAASQAITYGTSTVTLGGHLATGNLPATGSVDISLNGVKQTATIDASGDFSSSFDTHALAFSSTPYTITYHYATTTNFTGADDTSKSVTVNKVTPSVIVTDSSGTYNGSAFVAAATVNGGASLENVSPTLAYYSGTYTTLGVLSGVTPLSSAPKDAGSYTVVASFPGSADYSAASALTNFTSSPRTLHVTAAGQDRVYDGSLADAVTLSDDRVMGDTFTETYTFATFSDKNVGTGKAVSVSGIAISGGASANYTLAATTAPTAATITARAITLTAASDTKTYDGTTTANATPVATWAGAGNALATGDAASFSEAFTTSNAGAGLTLTASGSIIDGNSGQNYSITFVNSTAGTINRRQVSGSFTALGKIYDANTEASTASPTLGVVSGVADSGVIAADAANVSLVIGSASFADAIAGQDKTVTANGLTLAGTAASNYVLASTTATATATINKAHLTVTADDQSKTYDGSVFSAFTATLTGFVNGETAGVVSGTPAFSGSATTAVNAGNSTITPGLGTLAATNYDFTTFNNGTLTISAAPLTITVPNAIKTYGQTFDLASLGTTVATRVNGETLTITYSSDGAAATADVASYPIIATLSDGMGSLSNYAPTITPGTLTVGQATPTVTATAVGATYDGSAHGATSSAVTGVNNASLGAATSFTYYAGAGTSGTILAGAPKDAGIYTVVAHYAGSTDYAPVDSVPVIFTISPRAITVTPTAGQGKVYGDAEPAALGYSITGTLVPGDSFSGALLRAPGEDVGSYAIGQGSLALSSNYTLNVAPGVSFTITARPITVSADAQTKVYGTTDPALTYRITGGDLVNGDQFSGGLSRAAGEHVGDHAILRGTLAPSSNYSLTYIGADLSITPAMLTVTAKNASKVYGDANPAFMPSYSGFANGDDANALSGSLSLTTPADASSPVGTYTIAAAPGSLADPDYTFLFVDGTLTITKATLTITANDQTRVYGAANPTLDGTISGVKNNDPITASFTTTADATSDVGSYTITAAAVDGSTEGRLANYDVHLTNATLAVTPAHLTVTADARGKTYGVALDPTTLAGAVHGIQNGDAITASFSSAGDAAPAKVGGYAIAASLSGPKLALDYVVDSDLNNVGTLTVNPAALTITANSTSKTYGQTVTFAGTEFTTSGLVNGDRVASVTLQSDGAAARADVAGSPYAIYASGAVGDGLGNYTVSYVGGTLSVGKATLNAVADDQTKTYGAANPTLTGSLTGVVQGDSISITYTTAAGQLSDVAPGGYVITPVLSDPDGRLANYDVTRIDGTLTINQADQKIIWSDPAAIVYGTTLGAAQLDASVAGVPGGAVPGALTYAPAAGTLLHAGNGQTLTASAAANLDYKAASATVHLDVLKADPTVQFTTGLGTFTYDATSHGASATVAGVPGDDLGTPTITYNGSAVAPIGAGTYDVVASFAGNADYNPAHVEGTIEIDRATPMIAWADPAEIVYGTALSATQFDAVASQGPGGPAVSGSYTYSSPAGTVLAAGQGQVLTVTFTPDDTADYTTATATVHINVAPSPLTVTVQPATKVYGQDNPAFSVAYSGFVNYDDANSLGGTLFYSTLATDSSHVQPGGYAVSTSGLTSSNYAIHYVAGTLTITPATLSVVADPQTKVFGTADPMLSYVPGGFQARDTAATVLSGALARDPGEAVAGYAIRQGSLASDNDYTIAFAGSTLTITPATPTVRVVDAGGTYNGNAFAATATVAGVVAGVDSTPAASLEGVMPTLTYYNGTYSLTNLPTSGGTSQPPTAAGPYTVVASFPGSADYTGGRALANFAIGQAGSTVAVTGGTFTYDGGSHGGTNAVPSGAGTITGTPTLAYYLASDLALTNPLGGAPTNAGSYKVVATYAGDANHTGNSASAAIVINKARISYAIGSDSQTYGRAADLKDLLATFTTGVNGESLAISCSSAGDTGTAHVGSYDITGTLADDGTGLVSNYCVTLTNGTLTVNPYAFIYQVGNDSQTYGTPADLTADLPPTVNTGVNGQNLAIHYTSAGDVATAVVGDYDIAGTVSDGTGRASDYSVMVKSGALTVNKADLYINGPTLSRMYGDANPSDLSGSYTGQKNGETFTISGSTSAAAASPVGGYAIVASASGVTLSNYTVHETDGTLTVTPRCITVTADPLSKVYGTTNPALTFTVGGRGLASFDTQASAFTGALTRAGGENVGNYAITQGSLVADGNYTITNFTSSQLTITARPITVTADSETKVYGQSDPALTYKITSGSLAFTDAFTGGLTRAAGEDVGSYAIGQGSLALSSNYSLGYVGASLAITKAPTSVAVTSSKASSIYGDSVSFTATVTNTASNDPAVPAGSVQFCIDGSAFGTPVTLVNGVATSQSVSTLVAAGHRVTVVYTNADGNFSGSDNTASPLTQLVAKATPTVIWSTPAAITYGTPLSGAQLNASASWTVGGVLGGVAGTFTYTPSSGAVPGAGNRTLSEHFAPADTTDYNTPADQTVTLVVNQACPTFSNLAASQSIAYGTSTITVSGTLAAPTAVPSGQGVTISIGGATATATVQANGSFTTTVDTHLLHASSTAYTITYSYAGDSNFKPAGDTSTTLTVNPYAFTYQVGIDSQTFGSPANLAADLPATINTGVNGQNLAISYGSTGDVNTAIVGTYPITGAVSDGTGRASDYSVTVKSGTLTVNAEATTVIVSAAKVQYSDKVVLSATLGTTALAGQSLTGTVAFYINGGATPAATAAVDPGKLTATATTDSISLAPGGYSVRAIFTSTNPNFSGNEVTGASALTVTQEDATATYTGLQYLAVPSGTNTAQVLLSATVQDAPDGSPGDVTTAVVTFYIAETNQYIPATVGLVNPSDHTVGTASATVYLSSVTGSSPFAEYTVYTLVGYNGAGNYINYTAASYPTPVTVDVTQAVAGSIGGGGYIVDATSAGTYAGDVGAKTNFGLNVKYNKSGTNLQGGVNVVVQSKGHTYQIKSNSMTSLATQNAGTYAANGTTYPVYKAQFTSKSNLTDITNPSAPISLGGNLALQVTMTDNGEPGGNDTIAITLNGANGGILFASAWNGTQTVEQVLGGGNLQVRPAQFLDGPSGPGAPAGTMVTADQVRSLVPAAIERWATQGIPADRLAALAKENYIVDDLPAGQLGWQTGDTIAIDSDASGYGWFVDSSPMDNSEFASGRGTGAAGRVDLLTVLMHEMGHVLGYFEDADGSGTVMSEGLAPSVRHTSESVVAAPAKTAVPGQVVGDSLLVAVAGGSTPSAKPVAEGTVRAAFASRVAHVAPAQATTGHSAFDLALEAIASRERRTARGRAF